MERIGTDKVMLVNKSVQNIDVNRDGKIDGFQFSLKNPFYTAEPISSIKDLLLTIDGEKIDPAKVTLIVRGQEIMALKASTMTEVYWGFGEVIQVFVEKTGGLKKGSHELECILHLRTTVPYGYEHAKGYLEFSTKVTMTMT